MSSSNTNTKNKKSKRNIELSAEELALFCDQVSLILEAGIPLYDGFETLAKEAENDNAREIFEGISKSLLKQGSLYYAIKDIDIFPKYMVNMINIGEETGKLDDVLKSLNTYYTKADRTKKAIKAAISYPIVLLCMMSAVAVLIVTRILPIFEEIFKNLGTDMSSNGRAIMSMAKTLGYIVFGVTVVILVIVIAIYFIVKLGYGNKVLKVFGKLPFIKKISMKMSSASFSSVMSMMLSSGYSLEKALELAPEIVSEEYTKEKIVKCQKLVAEGKDISESLTEIEIFDGITNRMIGVGYKAGALDSVMKKISDKYEEEATESIEKIVSVIEPTLVAIMSIIIGGILIAVMLPLANIMSSIG